MRYFRFWRASHENFTNHPSGFPPINADQHKQLATYHLRLAEYCPEVALEYLASAQVHLLAALLARFDEAEVRAGYERQQLADRTVDRLVTALEDLLSPPRAAHVRIFHNLNGPNPLSPCTDSDPLVEVYTYLEKGVHHGTSDQTVANVAIWMFGTAGAIATTDEHSDEYRRRGNRPLADGDVVAVDGRFYRTTSSGWVPVTSPNLVDTGAPGSVPLRDAEGA